MSFENYLKKQWRIEGFQKKVSSFAKSSIGWEAKKKLQPAFFNILKYSKLNLASSNSSNLTHHAWRLVAQYEKGAWHHFQKLLTSLHPPLKFLEVPWYLGRNPRNPATEKAARLLLHLEGVMPSFRSICDAGSLNMTFDGSHTDEKWSYRAGSKQKM